MNANSGKKQRNQKNLREGKNSQEANKQRTTQNASEMKPEPQPQRSNRRQRNEVNNEKSTSETTPPLVKVKQNTEESITIDHSNLKRETEDIAKLTKKFTKREITSNWLRYSAPEPNVENQNTDQDAPADFSELLQVPVSRGGHLQLKEEQEWSNASRTALSGYFALDLKALGLSLATIPIHETLRLPKHLLTVEELSHFETLAEQAKQQYNPDELDDRKVFTSLIQSSADKESKLSQSTIKDSNNSQTCFSNIDHSEKYKEVFNSVIETNESKSLNQASINSTSSEDNIVNSSNQNEKESVKEEMLATECITNAFRPSDIVLKSKAKDKLGESILEPQEKQKPQFTSPTKTDHNIVLDNQSQNIDQVSNECFIKDENDFATLKQSEVNLAKPKEKRSSRRGNSKCQDNVEGHLLKTAEESKGINLDDDDDLNFLLSLKKPITSPVAIKGAAPAPIKESSVLPVVVSTSASMPKPSELDDWLESVLQD